MADETNPNAVSSIELATELTIAWLNNPNVKATAEDVPTFLKTMHATLGGLASDADKAGADGQTEHKPAVPVRSSVKPDYIVSLIDGRKLKSLKRHLSMHGLTPKDYRERYGLKPDYPMVAPNYSEQRREVAKKLGLGRKPAAKAQAAPAAAAVKAAPAKAKAAAKPKAAPKAAAPKAAPAPKAVTAAAPKPSAAPKAVAKPAAPAAPKPAAAKPAAAPKAKAAAPKPAAPVKAAPKAAAKPKSISAPVPTKAAPAKRGRAKKKADAPKS